MSEEQPQQPQHPQQPGPPPGYGAPPPGYGTPPPGYGYPPPPGQPYGAPPGYQPGYGYPQARGTNVLAIIALVSIFVFTPAALVFGLIARSQIKQSGESGDGMALAGIIVGGASIVFFVLLIGLLVFGVAASGGVVHTTPVQITPLG